MLVTIFRSGMIRFKLVYSITSQWFYLFYFTVWFCFCRKLYTYMYREDLQCRRPGLGRSLGGGQGSPLQYSCLENPHGQRSQAGYRPRGCKESDTTERLSTAQHMYRMVVLFLRGFFILICVLFLALMGLCCCKQAFSSFFKGLFSSCGVRASHCSGSSCYGAQAVGHTGLPQ